MSRRRLLWFTFGFASTYAVFSRCIRKDLLVERLALTSRVDQEFRSLEARLSNLDSSPSVPTPDQVTRLTILLLFFSAEEFRILGFAIRIMMFRAGKVLHLEEILLA
ncbi:hypothetical protein Fmac_010579 [Flemingia macrophylla]|uniref:Uncharacterized protein n=1 Tax=Flemingia macrophylla TaxID=520843 RepID=A0ABD1MJZ5_9FABA